MPNFFLHCPVPFSDPPMTAREFSDRFKPFVPVRRIATDAGFREGTFYMAVTRGRDLTPDEVSRLRAAVEAHAETLRRMAGELEASASNE